MLSNKGPSVMAIVNRTRDSFHDHGATFDFEPALDACRRAIRDGATWVDIGGVPFSPDAEPVTVAQEIDRVRPLVAALSDLDGLTISVDTWRSEVAAAVLSAGASVINDTSGLADPELAGVIADAGAGVIVTHSLAAPRTHLPTPHYDDIVTEVATFLAGRAERAIAAGVSPDRLVIDPGPDLNKSTVQTLELLRGIEVLNSQGWPWLAAVSNKDFIGETLDRRAGDRLPGTLAATMWCLERGASLVRTHDVAATVDAVRMWQALRGERAPAYQRHNV
ncbi:dihydropteroate synthase [Naumannella halotolerans]|uniref:Dihydropteroate synthase n=1 Tax=Naumannella halotolerans TaxID=993414 RepID=A0A4R7JA14_9ACTN|nr:dihydropteroate synthase [Naumannella halotolerans]TDT33756.1 dihydropteroate synthase [Naumannella halotolerans]